MLGPKKLEDKMTALKTWQSFCNVVHGFLERNKAEYKDSVETLVQTYCKLESRMSLKIQYLHSHMDFFQAKFDR